MGKLFCRADKLCLAEAITEKDSEIGQTWLTLPLGNEAIVEKALMLAGLMK